MKAQKMLLHDFLLRYSELCYDLQFEDYGFDDPKRKLGAHRVLDDVFEGRPVLIKTLFNAGALEMFFLMDGFAVSNKHLTTVHPYDQYIAMGGSWIGGLDHPDYSTSSWYFSLSSEEFQCLCLNRVVEVDWEALEYQYYEAKKKQRKLQRERFNSIVHRK